VSGQEVHITTGMRLPRPSTSPLAGARDLAISRSSWSSERLRGRNPITGDDLARLALSECLMAVAPGTYRWVMRSPLMDDWQAHDVQKLFVYGLKLALPTIEGYGPTIEVYGSDQRDRRLQPYTTIAPLDFDCDHDRLKAATKECVTRARSGLGALARESARQGSRATP
jgi:hypothetical protein